MPSFGYLQKVVTGTKRKGKMRMKSGDEEKHEPCTKHVQQEDTWHSVDHTQPGRRTYILCHIWI